MASLLVYNIADLVTCRPLAEAGRLTNLSMADLGRMNDAWMVITDGKIAAMGLMPVPPAFLKHMETQLDAQGCLVLPGLVDSHTHPLFAGARAGEFAMRLNGASYQEVAAAGGGIKASVSASRAASSASLLELTRLRCQQSLAHGVTSLEAKSGYGLGIAEELRHLTILNQLQQELPQSLRITCLALHAPSPDYPTLASYVQAVTEELLPEVARSSLASYADAFIEEGYFSVQDCEGYFHKAQDLGLGLRVHADEFSDAGAAAAAARWQAASADHLQFASDSGIAAMAHAGVVAILLPGTSLYTAIPYARGKRFTEVACPVAIASDFNPGSCLISNLPLLASLAGLHCGLKVPEIVAGVTYVAAYSLDLHRQKGALAPGFDGDFLVHPLGSLEAWLADLGQTKPASVWIKGKQAV